MNTVTHLLTSMPAVDNPIDNIVPNFSFLGAEFNALWKKLFAAAWALALLWTIFQLLVAITASANARGSNHPTQTAEARRDVAKNAVIVGAVAGFGIIVTLILALVG